MLNLFYLRGRENAVLESMKFAWCGPSRHGIHDTLPEAERRLSIIRNARSAEAAYRNLAHESAKQNSVWTRVPDLGFIFREDLEEFLQERSASGSPLPDHYREWENVEKAHHWLRSREHVFELFPYEARCFFGRFRMGEPESFTVTRETLPERYLYCPIPDSSVPLQLRYNRERCPLTEEQLIEISQFICETYGQESVCIQCDTEREAVVVERNRK